MRAFVQKKWLGGFLDYARGPREYRVQVQAWMALVPVDDLYFVRPKDPRIIWNYLREIGPAAVWTKIHSRWAEAGRNEKFVSCGIGILLDGPADALPPNSTVIFLAPKHPICVDRVTIPEDWCVPAQGIDRPGAEAGSVRFLPADSASVRPEWCDVVAGWDPESGVQFPRAQLAAILQDCRKLLQQADWSAAVSLPVPHTPITEFTPSPSAEARRPRAALFGYGNFAKTVVLPNLRETIDVVRIHEVDPIQLGRTPLRGCVSDTSPTIRPDEEWEACFIAGYHHTHAPLAIETLRRGSYAVVEKPTVTTQEQLQTLSAELSVRPNKLFECYQRRYTVLNDWARKDLEIGPQTPVDYHAIVYEVPLPARHWYRWPNSRTRLTSNGCHWIDHFLYLNGYAEPDRLELARGPRGIVNVSITLRNRAFGTMVLTDEGSERTGVQDHVELRANGRTAFIENNCHYRSEGRFGVIRRRRTHKIDSYRRMYRTIARQIVDGAPRDARQALQVSSRTILALEDML